MPGRPRLRSLTPLLVVADLPRALAFFARLGFVDPAAHGEPPCFAMLNRDGLELMLQLPEVFGTARANGPSGSWDVYLKVDDLAAEQVALAAAGVAIRKGPVDTAYGMREIVVESPDGHRICLAQDVASARAERYRGVLMIGERRLQLVLKLRREGDGYAATLDSPDQNAWDLPVDGVVVAGDELRFAMIAIGASFAGRLDDERIELDGTWTQRGHPFPLLLRREDGGA